MIEIIEKMYYVLYKLARKGNNQYDSGCIAALFLSIGVMIFFMNLDILIEILTGQCFILKSDTNLNVIVFSGAIIILSFSLLVFTGRYKHIEEKYKDITEEEIKQINMITILYYCVVFSLLVIGVVVYNVLK